jgi:hypothetical protein
LVGSLLQLGVHRGEMSIIECDAAYCDKADQRQGDRRRDCAVRIAP